MRRAVQSAACLVGLVVFAAPHLLAPALAQDAAAAEQPWRFEARAIDMTKMLTSGRGATPIPLADVEMNVTFDAPGSGDVTMTARTDQNGFFVLTGAEPAPGVSLTFWAAGQQFGENRQGYLAPRIHLSDDAPPANVEFYEVALDSSDIVLSQVIHVVSVINRDFENDDGPKEIMFRNTSMLENRGGRVWLGDPNREDGVAFAVGIPTGFELRNATVDGHKVPSTTGPMGHGGATGFVYRAPIFPTIERGTVIQVMFAAPYEEGQTYDASWHSEFAVDRYVMNLQEDSLTYVAPSAGSTFNELSDGGVNPPMGNLKVITHMWGLASIPPHGNVSAKFLAGRPFPMRPVLWIAAFVLLALGAAALGVAAARNSRKASDEIAAAEKHVRVPTGSAAQEREIELLDRRLRRGEITTVEHEIRRRAVEQALAVEASAATSHPHPEKLKKSARNAPAAAALLADVDRIAQRSADADEAQLRDDIKTLACAVRDLLERR